MIDSDQRPYSKRHPLMSLSQITVRFKGILKLVSFPNSQIYIWPIYWLGHMSVTSLDQRFPNNLVLQTYPVKINSERKNIGFHWTNCPVYKILGLYKRALFDPWKWGLTKPFKGWPDRKIDSTFIWNYRRSYPSNCCVWFFLLLLVSEACLDHIFFVFPDRSMIFGMWVHDHKVVCRVP